jgi:hypothetical protein
MILEVSEHTRFNPTAFFISKTANENQKDALHVTAVGFHRMFSDAHNIYRNVGDKNEKLSFSSHIVDTQEMKDTLDNFFRVNYVERCLEEQKLEPVWSFDFIDKYNISFLGKKKRHRSLKSKQNN